MKTKFKILSLLLTLCLSLGIIFTSAACAESKKPSGGGGGGGTDIVDDTPQDTNGVDTDMNSGTVYNMPANLTFTSITAESMSVEEGIVLNATVVPDSATNKLVDWTVAWVDPSSSWANGKNVNAYVTVTPSYNGSVIAQVVCLQAFGEKIQITVASRSNPEIAATCNVDYAQRATGASVALTATGLGDSAVTLSTGTDPVIPFYIDKTTGTKRTPTVTPAISSVYTVTDTFTTTVELKLSDSVIPKIGDPSVGLHTGAVVDVTSGFFPGKDFFKTLFFDLDKSSSDAWLFDLLYGFWGYEDPSEVNLSATTSIFEFVVTVTGTYSTFTGTYKASINAGSFCYPVTGITLDTGSIII